MNHKKIHQNPLFSITFNIIVVKFHGNITSPNQLASPRIHENSASMGEKNLITLQQYKGVNSSLIKVYDGG